MVRIFCPDFRVCPCGFGSVWAKNRRAIYHSKRCQQRFYLAALRAEFPCPKPHATCPICKRGFAQACKTQAYCSPRCRELAHGDRRRRKTDAPKDGVTRCCVICDLEFISRRWNQIYCCKACKFHVINQRRTVRKTDREPFMSRALIDRRCKAIQQQRERDGKAKGQTKQQPQRTEVPALGNRNPDCLREDSKGMD